MDINPFQSLARTAPLQDINYTKFDRTKDITEGDYKLTLDYGPYKNRKKTVLEYQNSVTQTRYYSGSYEKTINTVSGVTTTQEVHYISCGNGVNIAYVIEGSTGSYHYLHSDYLGSILAVSDASGNLEYEQNFDAWGRDRNPADWTYTASASPRPSWLYRGFTGHEHLREFTLINMNARMYDTETGRMLAVDNYVLDAHNSQDYNRYSYARNNPLKYSDPSGESVIAAIAIGAIVGAYIGGSSANGTFNPTKWENNSRTWWGIGIGAVTGGFGGFAFTSNSSSSSFVGGFGEGAAAGFSSGFVTGYVSGSGSQKDRLMSGLSYGLTSAALQGTANGIVGALHAKNLGLRGWDGAEIETKEMGFSEGPNTKQIGSTNCWGAGIECVDKSYGGSVQQGDIRWFAGGDANYNFMEDARALSGYKLNGGVYNTHSFEDMEKLADHMNNDGRIIVNKKIVGSQGHVLVVRKISANYVNGSISSYTIRTMDPYTGSAGYISETMIRESLGIYFFYRPR